MKVRILDSQSIQPSSEPRLQRVDVELPADDRAIILNQETAAQLGWKSSLEKSIRFHRQDYSVIGIVRDFHFESLHVNIKKMGMLLKKDRFEFAAVRFRGERLREVLDHVETSWQALSPPLPVEYSFLDDDYGNLYLQERKTRSLAGLFSSIAVFVSCLGLFGLVSYTAERRRREIGIRKILGASLLCDRRHPPSLFSLRLLYYHDLLQKTVWKSAKRSISQIAWNGGNGFRITSIQKKKSG